MWVFVILIVIIIMVVFGKTSIIINRNSIPPLFVLVSMLQPILLTRTRRKGSVEDMLRPGSRIWVRLLMKGRATEDEEKPEDEKAGEGA